MKKADRLDPQLPSVQTLSAPPEVDDHRSRRSWREGLFHRREQNAPEVIDAEHRLVGPHDRHEPDLHQTELHQTELHEHDPHAPRSFLQKTFSIDFWGWARLAAASLLAGVVLQAANIDIFSPDFNLGGAMNSIAQAIGNLGLWALANAWIPLIFGAIVVLPLWVIWRLLSSPFRH